MSRPKIAIGFAFGLPFVVVSAVSAALCFEQFDYGGGACELYFLIHDTDGCRDIALVSDSCTDTAQVQSGTSTRSPYNATCEFEKQVPNTSGTGCVSQGIQTVTQRCYEAIGAGCSRE